MIFSETILISFLVVFNSICENKINAQRKYYEDLNVIDFTFKCLMMTLQKVTKNFCQYIFCLQRKQIFTVFNYKNLTPYEKSISLINQKNMHNFKNYIKKTVK